MQIRIERWISGKAKAGPVSLNPKVDGICSPQVSRTVKLRPATPDDLELLQYWDRQPQVIAGKVDKVWQWETELACRPDWREQLIAEVDGRPIGCVQIIDPSRDDNPYWECIAEGHRAIDLWIGEKSDLDRGYGTQMMKQAIARCFADPTVTAILVDPLETNEAAHRFYERLGFEYVAGRCFGDDRCIVYRLSRPGTLAGHA
jgi:aminoglycoside 6'-N-acetyltransferase